MNQIEKDAAVTSPHTSNISTCEAKTFWQNQCTEGKVDVIFKQIQDKLQLLLRKIKDGSATDQEYTRALLWVKETNLENHETYNFDNLQEDGAFSPSSTEETFTTPLSPELEEPVTSPEPAFGVLALTVPSVCFEKHKCGKLCLSDVNPYFTRNVNPLKFPLLCGFQRRHAKSGILSRLLDVLYKAPCGRCLRNFEEVRFYLFQTECHFLSLDHFSFNTYLQLDRNPVKSQVVFQEADISRGVEMVPVSFCNEIDSTRPSFTYRKYSYPRPYAVNKFKNIFIGCCNCTDGCLNVSTCACLQLTARTNNKHNTAPNNGTTPGYTHKRLKTDIPTGLYECNLTCHCDRMRCQNRVVYHGVQVRLQVYKTKDKGWGVRCLDDLDKGTFVCIYTGRVFIKAVKANTEQDSNVEAIGTGGNKPTCISSKGRRVSHSDSEITVCPSIPTSNQNLWDSPTKSGCSQTEDKRRKTTCLSSTGKLDFTSIRRPKTKTSMLQKRRRLLLEKGTVKLQHSSDELSTPPASPKLQQCSDTDDKPDDDKNDKTVPSAEVECAKMANNGPSENSSSMLLDVCLLQQSSSNKKAALPNSCTEDNSSILDASKEGNVARFLNHSCSPNLFVQQVFVESHYRRFPWAAFFTKSFVKAGTELTWDYNYRVGSAPDYEIPCLCGQKNCRTKIL